MVTGFGETAGAPLAAHDGVDKVAFTGSTEVGKMIVQAAVGNLKKVTLELGGKSPNVVFADADPEASVAGAANAIFFNHGQCCVAGSRLYVERERFDEVVEGWPRSPRASRWVDGFSADTQMGPLVSDEQLRRVSGYLESGGRTAPRSSRAEAGSANRGYFIEPTVISKTNPDMKIVREEIFGPVVVAEPFQNLDEIAAVCQRLGVRPGGRVWTKDVSKAHAMAKRLRAGTVWINCYNIFDAALPFGGYKQSGWGHEMGHEALEAYTEVKAVCTQL